MMIREMFDFIVDPSITDLTVDIYLEKVRPMQCRCSLPSPRVYIFPELSSEVKFFHMFRPQKVLARGVLSVEDEIAD